MRPSPSKTGFPPKVSEISESCKSESAPYPALDAQGEGQSARKRRFLAGGIIDFYAGENMQRVHMRVHAAWSLTQPPIIR